MSGLRADARRRAQRADARPENAGTADLDAENPAADRGSVSNAGLEDGDIANLDELFGPDVASGTAVSPIRGSGSPDHPRAVRRRRAPKPLASWSLTASMFGLSMSWFMPWALPASLLGVVLGAIALFRRWEVRSLAGWGVGLGLAGAMSAGFWILWILDQLAVSPL